jgi:hypothetical protein
MSRKNYADFDEMEVKKFVTSDPNRYHALCLLKVRDNFAKQDYNEAYHWLYAIASPKFDKYEPWEELEKIADGESPTTVDVPVERVEIKKLIETIERKMYGGGVVTVDDFPNAPTGSTGGFKRLICYLFDLLPNETECDRADLLYRLQWILDKYVEAHGALSTRQQGDAPIGEKLDKWNSTSDYVLEELKKANSQSPVSLQPGVVEQLRKQNPWIGHGDYPMHGGYESCCDTLAKIIEGEKGKEVSNG